MLHFFGPLCINLAQIYLLYIAVSLAELSNQSDFPPTKVLLFKLLYNFSISAKTIFTKRITKCTRHLYEICNEGMQKTRKYISSHITSAMPLEEGHNS